MNIIEKARVFATAAHYAAGNARKYTGEPYINHPTAVVLLVAGPGELQRRNRPADRTGECGG